MDKIKVIILAAGEGTRLKKYTKNIPKGMLKYKGKSLIKNQIDIYKECNIEDISIVRGFCAEKIAYNNINYYENKKWQETNMVVSFLCAKTEFNSNVIVSYADIIFTKELVQKIIAAAGDYLVAVDIDWETYWMKRYGKIDFDTESLELDNEGNIISLGIENPSINEIDGRFIGIMKFSQNALKKIVEIYNNAKEQYWEKPWGQSGKPFKQAYMTDLLQELINNNNKVKAVKVSGGWMEFDTNEDYEKQKNMTL